MRNKEKHMEPKTVKHITACESILLNEIAENTKRNILPSVNKVAERLLSRRIDLDDAYREIYGKLGRNRQALWHFFDGLLSVSTFWNPDKLTEAREARLKLNQLNDEIADKAGELAALLEKRSALNGSDGFHADTHYGVLEVLEVAARSNYLYESYVRDQVRTLWGQYDLKYWPSLAEFVMALSVDARGAVIQATDPLTAAGTISKRASRADFFRAWFRSIVEYRYARHLPLDFELSDSCYASLANCVLDLGPDHLTDAGYVKGVRQRDREAGRVLASERTAREA